MRPTFVATLFVTVLAMSGAVAQTSPTHSHPTKVAPSPADLTGNFKPLDLLEKLKLAGAYFTNPKAVRDIQIVYVFDPMTFVASEKYPQLWTLAKDGKVTFGIPDKAARSIKVVSVVDLMDDYKVESQVDLSKLLASKGISVIAGKDSLLGSSATQALVRDRSQ